MSDIKSIKDKFISDFKSYLPLLEKAVSCNDMQWTIKGFLDIYKNVYTISSDTKVVSKILEIHIFPIISEMADKMNYEIKLADKQNYYPDLTFINKDDKNIKFAVDIKTTYRTFRKIGKGYKSEAGFTLGSHGSYFTDRNSKKNIQFPYKDYSGHFCLAIVYSQAKEKDEDSRDLDEMKIFHIKELGSSLSDPVKRKIVEKDFLTEIMSVIKDLKFYFVEKWKIASDSQGSGNTANIGSTKTEQDLADESGVFSKLGEEYFDGYWQNYNIMTITLPDGSSRKLNNIWDYLAFKNEKNKFDLVGNGAKRMPKEYKKLKDS